MADWHPAHLSPNPDPWFVQALKEIDPDMRVVWGMERYFRAEWAIERKMDSEEYAKAYAAVVLDGGPRYVDQPVLDNSQPIKDEEGSVIGYVQVGINRYDLAPEYEWLTFCPVLVQSVLDALKKRIWEYDHPVEAALLLQQEEEDKEGDRRAQRLLASMEGVDEAFKEVGREVVFGYGATRKEGK